MSLPSAHIFVYSNISSKSAPQNEQEEGSINSFIFVLCKEKIKKKLPDYFSGEGGAGAGTGVPATKLEGRKEEEEEVPGCV